MPLSRITIPDTEFVADASGIQVLNVRDPHALVKAAGYLKFTHAGTDKSEAIYFRGERKVYGNLSPTLFRGFQSQKAKAKRITAIKNTLASYRDNCPIFSKFGFHAHEPLLQHYGISTTWIDLVDNLWVALWFACHQAKSSGDQGQYLHFEKRVPSNKDEYAYILLIGADINKRHSKKAGFFHGDNTELVDLRMAAPSIFLRPHAQHGLLFRCRGDHKERPHDYSKQIRGLIRVSLNDALSWLGEGKIVGTHSLFPPAFYDDGYRILLESEVDITKGIGGISLVGA
ncbi:MAG: hypothetical protein ACI9SP_004774 [Arenicella sp.]